MKQKVRFYQYKDYWVATAENGAVSQGDTLGECRTNIIDAMTLLEEYEKEQGVSRNDVLKEFEEEIEVSV